jgi:transposase
LQITDRSGHWITEQVGRRARSVSEVAKELIRSLYDHENEELALTFITRRGHDFNNAALPEVRSLGRTLLKWKKQIVAWHQAHVANGPTEAPTT